MKKSAAFKLLAVLLSFLLVVETFPLAAYAEENFVPAEPVSSLGSEDPNTSSETSSENPSEETSSEIELPATSSEGTDLEAPNASSDAETASSGSETEQASSSEISTSSSQESEAPDSVEETVASALVANGNENPINEPDLASQYGYSLPPFDEDKPSRILGEDISLREESTKYFRLEDGGYLAAGYPVPVHYLDKETGKYTEINNDLNRTTISGKTYYTNADNPFQVSLPENLSSGQPILVSQDGNTIGFTYLPDQNAALNSDELQSELEFQPNSELQSEMDSIESANSSRISSQTLESAKFNDRIQITNRVGLQEATAARSLYRSSAALTEEQRIEMENEKMQKAEKVESKALYVPQPNVVMVKQFCNTTV